MRGELPSHRSNVASQREELTSTRRFTNNYAAFYNVPNLNEDQATKAKAVRAQLNEKKGAVNVQARLNTGMLQDPNFQANKDRFYGESFNENNEFYKNYRAFYASTPQVKYATHMGAKQQDQQKSIVRNRLAENAKRILN